MTFEVELNLLMTEICCRYDIMTACWAVDPAGRPMFEELTKTISALLKQADTGSQRWVPLYQVLC